jgi:5-formyltetrahydrofolate cyclo-ligase
MKNYFELVMGGGFYDQTFANLLGRKKRPLLIGLGYDCLKSELNFQTQKDVRLDKIITEKGVYV